MYKILVVDDDKEARGLLNGILGKAGYRVEEAASGRESIKKTAREGFDVVLLDLMMPDISGIDVLIEMKRSYPKVKVIMLTAFATIGTAKEAIKRGASDYIAKPFQIEELMGVIRQVLEEARFEETVTQLHLDDVLFYLSSPIRREVIKFLHQKPRARFKEILKGLGVREHTKLLFHIKHLKDSEIVEQDRDKLYVLTDKGAMIVETLFSLEQHFKTD